MNLAGWLLNRMCQRMPWPALHCHDGPGSAYGAYRGKALSSACNELVKGRDVRVSASTSLAV